MDSEGSKRVNPWAGLKPSVDDQTGGDWYNIILTASLGGKQVHGCNSSPSCEVLCKSTVLDNLDKSVGYIRWDDNLYERERIGDDISDQFYTHHSYKGTTTSSGNVLAYETGLWEPSLRAKARSTSLLAAGIHAHGGSIGDAIGAVSKIASDDVDEEAVVSALLPASHLKREMIVVSKANHRLFSKGSIQCGIEWDDTELSLGSKFPTMAFDWGRVTTLARYIAEANIQVCPRFRSLAKRIGIPYYIVRDAWAYVASTDYNLTTKMFENVPTIDLKRHKIPSLKGAFVDHEEDVLIAVTRSLSTYPMVPNTDSLKAYSNLYRQASMRQAKRRKRNLVDIADYIEPAGIESHMGLDEIDEFVDRASVPNRALIKAIVTRRNNDAIVRNVITSYNSLKSNIARVDEEEAIDNVSKVILDHGTWILACSLGEDEFVTGLSLTSDERRAMYAQFHCLLSSLKDSMFGVPSHLSARSSFVNSVLVRLRVYTRQILSELDKMEPAKRVTQRSLIRGELRETADVISGLNEKLERWLPVVNTNIKAKFSDWAKIYEGGVSSHYAQAEANLVFTATALGNLTITDCRNQSSGFIDCSAPERTYIREAMRALSRGSEIPPLAKYRYTNALMLANELDSRKILPYDVGTAVTFATKVLGDVIGDIMHDRLYRPNESIMDELKAQYPPPSSPGYDTSAVDEAEEFAILQAMFNEVEKEKRIAVCDEYTLMLNTYPTSSLAEEYARVSGFKSFRDAFDELGSEVANLESSRYISKAAALLAIEKGRKKSGNLAIKRGYSSLI